MTGLPRVAYVLWTFPGRSETFITSEISAIAAHGIEVRAFAAGAEAGLTAPVPTVYAAPRPPLGSVLGGLRHLWYARGLATDGREFAKSWWLAVRLHRAVARYRPHVVHSHFANHPTLVALILARWLGIPATAMFHANDYLIGVSPQALGRRIGELAAVCAISQGARTDILDRTGADPARVVVVRAGLAAELIGRPPAPADSARIVSVARLMPKKGHQHLIAGFAELVASGDRETELVIVGEGPERDGLERQIIEAGLSGRVRLTGALDHGAALDLVWDARVAALTAVVTEQGDADGIPVFLMEAAAAGRPIVTTPVGGVPELITDQVSGRLLPGLDPAAVADALRSAMTPAGRQWGRAAREQIDGEFDPRRQVRRLLALWQRVVETGGRR